MSVDQSSETVATDGRDPGPVDPWTDLAAFVALPQLTGLVLGPDGRRLVAVVAQPGPEHESVESLWLIDPDGQADATRLTRSGGASAPAFLPDGSLLYLSARADPEDPGHNGSGRDSALPGLWRLPANGGEPERIATSPGGITGLEVARRTGRVTVAAPSLASGETTDERRRNARKERKVSAILHERARVRSWDHDLRPDPPRLLVRADDRDGSMRDLAPDAAAALTEASWTISDDGEWVVTEWQSPLSGGRQTHDLAVIDLASGDRRILVGDRDAAVAWSSPVASPDGRRVACIREVVGSPEHIPDVRIEVIDVASGDRRTIDTGVVWPHEVAWSPAGDALFVAGDGEGHHPLLRVDLEDGTVTRLTAAGGYRSPCPAPDGVSLYAIASAVDRAPRPVCLAQHGADQTPVDLRGPATPNAPGRLEEVRTAAADGTALRAWLVLPPEASPATPAPLLLWVHGGPLGSWNEWHWRWCPHVMAARGWAVLLPDPALSTGYGDEMVRRGWNQWGGAPYHDVMALTDAALARPDLDATRTAMMGGSYGGYMANWIAGHTDRFKAIVSHASVYNLVSFQNVTDYPDLWAAEWDTPERNPDLYREWSPHHHVDAIRTPMLLIHGNRDYRCPVAESIALWTELRRRDVQSQFLYFPDEGHWVVKPGNRMAWYQTVLAFLDRHVLGKPWVRPELV